MLRNDAHRTSSQGLAAGPSDVENSSAKLILAAKLNALMEQRGLSQKETAKITGMTQPKISKIRRYKLENISLERLMQALVSLGQRVEIVITPAPKSGNASITVAR